MIYVMREKDWYSYVPVDEILNCISKMGFDVFATKVVNLLLLEYTPGENEGYVYCEFWMKMHDVFFETLLREVRTFEKEDIREAWENESLDDLLQFAIKKGCMTEKIGNAINGYMQMLDDEVSAEEMVRCTMDELLWDKLGLLEENDYE